MAAIIPHLEVPHDVSPIERAYDMCVGTMSGDYLGEDHPACPAPDAVLADAHAGLLGMVFVRDAVFASLTNKQFVTHPGNINGSDTRNVYLVLDQPIGPGPAWNPATNPGVQQYQLLSWTSKMNTPSWSLPAGAPQIGGACPGAVAGQSIVPEKALRSAARLVNIGLGRPADAPVNLPQSICEHCVTGDTKVLVEGRGWVSIEQLVEEDRAFRVWSGIAWRETHAVFQGIKPIVELTTSWGHVVRATPDHKILTDDHGMVPIEELREGDRLVFQPPEEAVWPTRTPLPALNPSGHHNEIGFEHMPTEWTYDVGLLAGYVLGDGTIYGGKHPTVSLVAAEHDRGDLERLLERVKSWCSTDASITVRENAANGFTSQPNRSIHLALRVKAIAQLLAATGLDKTAPPEARRAPIGLWTATRDGVCGFLSGLFSTDGCVSLSRSKFELSLAAVSEPLLRDAQLLLMNFGIRSTICAYETSNAQRVVQGYRPLYKLSISSIGHVRMFAEKIGFWNARKQQKLEEGLIANADRLTQQKLPTVEAITWLDEEAAVYDLINVGDEHQFLANGVTFSNCYATGGQYSTGQVQFAQLLRFLWSRQAISFNVQGPFGPSTAFVETMVYAINAADYRLDGGTVKGEGAEATQDLPPEPTGRRFFRIHDSGDFFEEEYLRQWKMIADRLPDITFWAPSRIWATSWGIDAVNSINSEPRNFVIRPSAYEVNEPGPVDLGPGWAGPTTVIAVQQNLGMTPEREQYVSSIEHKSAPRGGTDPRYTWDCVAIGTPVHVQGQGLTNIEAIVPGVKVMTRDGWRNVVRSEARSTKATLVIETTGGQRLRVTHDHQIAGPTGWCTADELQPGDKLIAMPEDGDASYDSSTVHVPKWDRSIDLRGAAHGAAQFPEYWSRELGLVLGYLTGDAHFREASVEVEVGTAKRDDLHHLDLIISKWLGYGAKFDERVHQPSGLVDSARVSQRALWHSVQFVRYLQGFGLGQKSPMRRLPSGLLQAPRAAQLGFLAGYLSADGSVTARREGGGEVRAFTTSASMATELSLLWSVLGARVSVSTSDREPYKTLHTIMGRSAAALSIAKEAQLLNDEKNAVAQALKVPERTRVRYVSVTQIVDDGLVVPTWDLEVEGANPEFVAGGVLVHNCRAYATDDAKHTCRKAVAPPGLGNPNTGKGCRACWLAPQEIVNYSLH